MWLNVNNPLRIQFRTLLSGTAASPSFSENTSAVCQRLMIYLWLAHPVPELGCSPVSVALPAPLCCEGNAAALLSGCLPSASAEQGLCQGFGSPSLNGPAVSPVACIKPLLPLILAISCRSIHLFGKETQTGSAACKDHRFT